MKSLTKAIAVASLATVATAAQAGTSLTVGAVSDYYFRGVNLGDAGGYLSLDYENNGFYVGTWWIDDGNGVGGGNDGLETDVYFGYGGEAGDFSYGIGYSRFEYTYTSDFEHEINLSGAIAGFGLDIAIGVDDNEDSDAGEDQDYTVIELSYGNGPYGVKLGSYDVDNADAPGTNPEAEYKWIEASYTAEIGTFDVTATVGQAFDVEATSGGTTVELSSAGNNYIIFDISKGFDL